MNGLRVHSEQLQHLYVWIFFRKFQTAFNLHTNICFDTCACVQTARTRIVHLTYICIYLRVGLFKVQKRMSENVCIVPKKKLLKLNWCANVADGFVVSAECWQEALNSLGSEWVPACLRVGYDERVHSEANLRAGKLATVLSTITFFFCWWTIVNISSIQHHLTIIQTIIRLTTNNFYFFV